MRTFLIPVFFLLCLNLCVAEEKELKHYKALIHIHTNYSCGKSSILDYYRFASENDIQILIFCDHLKTEFEYGIKPFDNTLSIKKKFNSLDANNIKKYLEEIRFANLHYSGRVIGIDGVEITPHYYIEGSYWGGDLTVYDARKHILAIGLNDGNVYTKLLSSLNSTKIDTWTIIFAVIAIFFTLFVCVAIFRNAKRKKILLLIALTLLCAFIFLGITNGFFREKRRSQDFTYDSFTKIEKFANSQGGLIFWAHPDALLSSKGDTTHPVTEKTSPYPESLLLTENYVGFAGVYGDATYITNLHNLWDKMLLEYCNRNLKNPPFIYSEPDLRSVPEKDGQNFITVILSNNLDKKSILDSIKKGRMYATAGGGIQPTLNFYLTGDDSTKYFSGDTAICKKYPSVVVTLHGNIDDEFLIYLICDDKIVETSSGKPPLILGWSKPLTKGRHYFRTEVVSLKSVSIKSNPIFVEIVE